jgi:hypothetical protein
MPDGVEDSDELLVVVRKLALQFADLRGQPVVCG